jgi:hypothetical protein
VSQPAPPPPPGGPWRRAQVDRQPKAVRKLAACRASWCFRISLVHPQRERRQRGRQRALQAGGRPARQSPASLCQPVFCISLRRRTTYLLVWQRCSEWRPLCCAETPTHRPHVGSRWNSRPGGVASPRQAGRPPNPRPNLRTPHPVLAVLLASSWP